MGSRSHFKRLVSGRFFIYQQDVSTVTDDGLPDGRLSLYDLYDPFNDFWLGTFDTFGKAMAACREATRKDYLKYAKRD